MDGGAWRATVHRVTGVGHHLATKPPPPPLGHFFLIFSMTVAQDPRHTEKNLRCHLHSSHLWTICPEVIFFSSLGFLCGSV